MPPSLANLVEWYSSWMMPLPQSSSGRGVVARVSLSQYSPRWLTGLALDGTHGHTPAGSHPLHVSRADDVVVAGRVLVLDAALEGDGHRLEAAVRMLADAEPLLGRVKLPQVGQSVSQPVNQSVVSW